MLKQAFQKALLVASVALLLPLAGRAQNPPPQQASSPAQQASSAPDKFSQQFWQLADTLRPKLDEWKTTVDGFDFDRLKMGKEGEVILHTLESDKLQCLHSLTTLWLQIPIREKFPSPPTEVDTLLQMIWLQSQLLKLESDINIAFAVALASGSMNFNDPQSATIRGWTASMNHIAADLGNNFLSRMQMQMRSNLVMLYSEAMQCRAQKSVNP